MKTRRRKSAQKPGRRVGQMRPFTPENIMMLESKLRADDSITGTRDLALLRVGIDTMLRSIDVVNLTVGDVVRGGEVLSEFTTKQKKTKRPVECALLEDTRDALKAWLDQAGITGPEARLFSISTRQHQRIVKQWCDLLNLDGSMYSTHSIRRTKPSAMYAQTKNIAEVKELLGHSNSKATELYLGVDRKSALEAAKRFKI
jgi:integrase